MILERNCSKTASSHSRVSLNNNPNQPTVSKKSFHFSEELVRHGFYKETSMRAAEKAKRSEVVFNKKKIRLMSKVNDEFDKEMKLVLKLQSKVLRMQTSLACSIQREYSSIAIQMYFRCHRARVRLRELKLCRYVSCRWRFFAWYKTRRRSAKLLFRTMRTYVLRKSFLAILPFLRALRVIQRKYRSVRAIREAKQLLAVKTISRRTTRHCLLLGLTRAATKIRTSQRSLHDLVLSKVALQFLRRYIRRRRIRYLRSARGKIAYYWLSQVNADAEGEQAGVRTNESDSSNRNMVYDFIQSKVMAAHSVFAKARKQRHALPEQSTVAKMRSSVLSPHDDKPIQQQSDSGRRGSRISLLRNSQANLLSPGSFRGRDSFVDLSAAGRVNNHDKRRDSQTNLLSPGRVQGNQGKGRGSVTDLSSAIRGRSSRGSVSDLFGGGGRGGRGSVTDLIGDVVAGDANWHQSKSNLMRGTQASMARSSMGAGKSSTIDLAPQNNHRSQVGGIRSGLQSPDVKYEVLPAERPKELFDTKRPLSLYDAVAVIRDMLRMAMAYKGLVDGSVPEQLLVPVPGSGSSNLISTRRRKGVVMNKGGMGKGGVGGAFRIFRPLGPIISPVSSPSSSPSDSPSMSPIPNSTPSSSPRGAFVFSELSPTPTLPSPSHWSHGAAGSSGVGAVSSFHYPVPVRAEGSSWDTAGAPNSHAAVESRVGFGTAFHRVPQKQSHGIDGVSGSVHFQSKPAAQPSLRIDTSQNLYSGPQRSQPPSPHSQIRRSMDSQDSWENSKSPTQSISHFTFNQGKVLPALTAISSAVSAPAIGAAPVTVTSLSSVSEATAGANIPPLPLEKVTATESTPFQRRPSQPSMPKPSAEAPASPRQNSQSAVLKVSTEAIASSRRPSQPTVPKPSASAPSNTRRLNSAGGPRSGGTGGTGGTNKKSFIKGGAKIISKKDLGNTTGATTDATNTSDDIVAFMSRLDSTDLAAMAVFGGSLGTTAESVIPTGTNPAFKSADPRPLKTGVDAQLLPTPVLQVNAGNILPFAASSGVSEERSSATDANGNVGVNIISDGRPHTYHYPSVDEHKPFDASTQRDEGSDDSQSESSSHISDCDSIDEPASAMLMRMSLLGRTAASGGRNEVRLPNSHAHSRSNHARKHHHIVQLKPSF